MKAIRRGSGTVDRNHNQAWRGSWGKPMEKKPVSYSLVATMICCTRRGGVVAGWVSRYQTTKHLQTDKNLT